MSFFRKLFNRVSGKEEQDAPAPAAEETVEEAATPLAEEPPGPDPELDVTPVAEVPEAEPAPEPEPAAVPSAEPEPERRSGWFSRLSEGLSKSSRSITGSITSIFTKKKLDKATLQDLEDVLLQADLGLPMAERIVKRSRHRALRQGDRPGGGEAHPRRGSRTRC